MVAIHVHAPKGKYYGQIKGRGCRKWETVIVTYNSAKFAMAGAVKRMKPDTKRFRVIFCCEWYDPVLIMEVCKK